MCPLDRVGLYIVPMLTKLARLLRPAASKVAPASLSLGALGCGVGAAWTQGTFWGLAGTAAALLLAEWRMIEPKPQAGRQ